MEAIFDFIFKITSRIPMVKEWFRIKKPMWAWLNDWAIECKFPVNPMDNTQNLRIYKRRNNMQLHSQFLKSEYYKNIIVREARIKRMELLMKGE